jgi:hypothetical protein
MKVLLLIATFISINCGANTTLPSAGTYVKSCYARVLAVHPELNESIRNDVKWALLNEVNHLNPADWEGECSRLEHDPSSSSAERLEVGGGPANLGQPASRLMLTSGSITSKSQACSNIESHQGYCTKRELSCGCADAFPMVHDCYCN